MAIFVILCLLRFVLCDRKVPFGCGPVLWVCCGAREMVLRVNKRGQRKRKGKEWSRFWACVCSWRSLDGTTKGKKKRGKRKQESKEKRQKRF